jgi:hypothetical protein
MITVFQLRKLITKSDAEKVLMNVNLMLTLRLLEKFGI